MPANTIITHLDYRKIKQTDIKYTKRGGKNEQWIATLNKDESSHEVESHF